MVVISTQGLVDSRQQEIDERNRQFWNELCGTQLAMRLGVKDSSPQSLALFDRWYFDFYPYLLKHVPVEKMAGKRVLEIGLGYGTLSQRIAEAGADYTGLDIAAGPVQMVNHRLAQMALRGQARQGSILDAPFPDGSFDWVVSIGCLHHTGNLQRALDECWRVLKPGGEAMVMVYSATSYRQWATQPRAMLARIRAARRGRIRVTQETTEAERASYDASVVHGGAAPETVFTTAVEMRNLTRRWSACRITKENIGQESILALIPRPLACRLAGPILGLDLYCHLVK